MKAKVTLTVTKEVEADSDEGIEAAADTLAEKLVSDGVVASAEVDEVEDIEEGAEADEGEAVGKAAAETTGDEPG